MKRIISRRCCKLPGDLQRIRHPSHQGSDLHLYPTLVSNHFAIVDHFRLAAGIELACSTITFSPETPPETIHTSSLRSQKSRSAAACGVHPCIVMQEHAAFVGSACIFSRLNEHALQSFNGPNFFDVQPTLGLLTTASEQTNHNFQKTSQRLLNGRFGHFITLLTSFTPNSALPATLKCVHYSLSLSTLLSSQLSTLPTCLPIMFFLPLQRP